MLIDTHAHLDYSDFDDDRAQILSRATERGVTEIISNWDAHRLEHAGGGIGGEFSERVGGCRHSPRTRRMRRRTMRSSGCGRWRRARAWWRWARSGSIIIICRKARRRLRRTRARQAELFRAQLGLAVELGLNAVIHQRDSWDDTLAILREFTGRVRGVFHCFGGTLEQAQEVIALGHLVSFTGIVTFKNARQVQATAQDVTFDQFMVETDCPYLAPVPDRGKRCEPAHTRNVADQIAQLRGVSVEEIAARTTETARAFFRFGR